MRFLHCSDVHVTQRYAGVRWRDMGWRRGLAMFEHTIGGRARAYRHAAATLRLLAAEVEHGRADHLLVTGDLTAYAMDEEFRGARAALGRVGDSRATCSVIPGNHDRFTPAAVNNRRFEHEFSHLLEGDMPAYRREGPFPFVHLTSEDTAVVGLLSARLPPVPGLAFGRIGGAQLSALRDLLEDTRLKHRAILVMVHHAPLRADLTPDSRTHGLADADVLLRLLPGPRFAVVHGHLHRRFHHVATATRPHLFCAGSSTQHGREGGWIIEARDGAFVHAEIYTPSVIAGTASV